MSYYAIVSFKQMAPDKIMPFLKQFKQSYTDVLKLVAEQDSWGCPFIQDNKQLPETFAEVSREDKERVMNWAHTCKFKFKFFYNERLGLLGMFSVPHALQSLFDGTVVFQNSTDTDYDISMYENIEPFKATYSQWMNMSVDDIKKQYAFSHGREFEEDYEEYSHNENLMIDKLNYVRRMLCYKEILRSVEEHIWSDDDVHFSLYSLRERDILMKFVKYCYDMAIKMQ